MFKAACANYAKLTAGVSALLSKEADNQANTSDGFGAVYEQAKKELEDKDKRVEEAE